MHSKQVDRTAKRRLVAGRTDPDGDGEPDPSHLERMGRLQGALEHAAEATLRAAFDRFFDAWFDRVYAFARKTGRDTAYAEALTTLIFMRELARRLASDRIGRAAGEPAAASDRDALGLRRKGRAS
jgi:hypothetical protein